MGAWETVPDQQIAKSGRQAVCRTGIIAHPDNQQEPVFDAEPGATIGAQCQYRPANGFAPKRNMLHFA